MNAQEAFGHFHRQSPWPGVLALDEAPQADHDAQGGLWKLTCGESQVQISDSTAEVVSGQWKVNPNQAILCLVTSTGLALLGVYGLAYAAKIPTITACLLLNTSLGRFGPFLTALASLAVASIWGAYLLSYLQATLREPLDWLLTGQAQLPSSSRWREPLRLLAIGQAIYVMDSLVGAWQRHELSAPLALAMLFQVGVVAGCCHLSRNREFPFSPWLDVARWSALWLASLLLNRPGALIGAALTVMASFYALVRMSSALKEKVLHREASRPEERLFWLCVQMMVLVSMGAWLGHTLYWASIPLHGKVQDALATQAWVWGATLGTLGALLIAPLGPVRLPLFLASTLYQALLTKMGPGPAVAGAILVILIQSWHKHPGEYRRILYTALTFGLAESSGRLLGAAAGFFFLGFEGGSVGAALGERTLGAYALLQAENSPDLSQG